MNKRRALISTLSVIMASGAIRNYTTNMNAIRDDPSFNRKKGKKGKQLKDWE